MARSVFEDRITPSVLDRLIDHEPQDTSELFKSRSQTLHELKASVARDLEWLLNTRRTAQIETNGSEEIRKSVVAFGLPDLTSLSSDKSSDWRALAKYIESALSIFEPRFFNVKVTIDTSDEHLRTPRFRIEANLDVDPAPEPVTFGTDLESGTTQFQVREIV